MTDRPTPEDDFNDLLEAAVANRDAVTIDTFVRAPDQPTDGTADPSGVVGLHRRVAAGPDGHAGIVRRPSKSSER